MSQNLRKKLCELYWKKAYQYLPPEQNTFSTQDYERQPVSSAKIFQLLVSKEFQPKASNCVCVCVCVCVYFLPP